MINSIKKGKNFEREVAHLLTEKTGVKWIRVPQSGATATTKGTENFCGDLFTEDKVYKDFVIECKHRREQIHLSEIFNKKSLLHKWIEQVKTEAKGRPWALFFRGNRENIFVLTNDNTEFMLHFNDEILTIVFQIDKDKYEVYLLTMVKKGGKNDGQQ